MVKHRVDVKRQTWICTTWPSFPFSCRLLFIISAPKFAVSRNFLSIRIVLSWFYLLIFYFEKFSTWLCRLQYAVYVKLNLTIIMKSGSILEVSAIMGRGVGWGNGTFSGDFRPHRKEFQNTVTESKWKKKRFSMRSLLECKYIVFVYTCHWEAVSYVLSPLIRPVEYNQKLPKISLLPVPLPHLSR